jgi:ATP-dependent DNA ligase
MMNCAQGQQVRREAVPAYAPQLARLVEDAPEGDEWLIEIKYDGYRMGALVKGGTARLESRRGRTGRRHTQ